MDEYEEIEDFTQSLNETYNTTARNGEYEDLWYFLDVAFDQAARRPISLSVQHIFWAVEDFCKFKQLPVDQIPQLYRDMFGMRDGGVLAQSKYPYYNAEEWMAMFPEPLKPKCPQYSSILWKLRTYLHRMRYQEKWYEYTLSILEKQWMSADIKSECQ